MILIATGQLAQWRQILAHGYEVVDITAKSGFPWFAPEYADVMAYKHGQLSETDYTERYIGKMRETFRSHHAAWVGLKTKPKACYVCYCRSYEANGQLAFCHRHIFVQLLAKYLDRENVTYTLKGEIR